MKDYQLQENEIKISVDYLEYGSLNSSLISSKLPKEDIFFVINKNSIWFEKQGVFGFKIDKDIAICLLKKIAEDNINSEIRNVTYKINCQIDENSIKNQIAKFLEECVNDSKIVVHSDLDIIRNQILSLNNLINLKVGNFKDPETNDLILNLHKDTIEKIKKAGLDDKFIFSEKENGTKRIQFKV